MCIIGCHQADFKGNQMAVQKSLLEFLTRVTKKNKSGTSQTIEDLESIQATALKGGFLYISNAPPIDPDHEVIQLAHLMLEMILTKYEQGEYLSFDEMIFIVELLELQIEEAHHDAA